MATYLEVGRGPVELDQTHFVAQGGEGAVYCRDGVAYKVFHDAARALPQGKLRLLAALDAPTVVRPERLLLRDGAPVGYAMRWIPDARPLAPYFTPAFRRRHGVTPEAVAALVESMRRTVAHAHARGALVVDLNDLNCLVPPSHDRACFIDVDSWQVPGYPATALLDTVRDRHATAFHEGSDWFSWAVVTFQLWLGVHPYRGKHPTLATLEDRMRADASVFDPAVTLPPACPPLDAVPARLRAWYEAVFERRHRDPPPAEGGALVVAALRPLRSGQHLVITPLRTYDGPVRAFGSAYGVAVAVTDRGVWLDAHRVGPAPAGQPAVGFDRQGRPVVAALHDGRVTAWQHGEVRGGVAARALVGHAGHLHALVGDRVVELEVRAGTLLGRPVARVLPRAAQLFPGVAIQHLLGAAWITLLPSGRQVRVPELDGHRVLDAAHAGGALVVLAARGGAWHRFTVRVGADLDVQIDADVERPEVNVAVLDRGVLVRLDDDDALTLLPAAAHAHGQRRVADPALGADLALATHDGGLVALRGDALLGLALRG